MPKYEFNAVLSGSANGGNTFALQNPQDGELPYADQELSISLPLAQATGIFEGTETVLNNVKLNDVAGTYLNSATNNAALSELYTSESGYSLYDLVKATARTETVPVVSEIPTDTVVTDVTPLGEVLDLLGDGSHTDALALIREQLYTNDSENRWVQDGAIYKNVPKVADQMVFYATYTVTITSKYALDGVGEGATILYWNGAQNVSSTASSLTSGTTSASRTFKIVVNVVENPAPDAPPS